MRSRIIQRCAVAFASDRVRVGTRWVLVAVLCGAGAAIGQSPLPRGERSPEPLATPHFPSRLHAFIWRNWEVSTPARMAEVLSTSPENVEQVAASMGLPPHRPLTAEQQQRIYITVIRRNWHLLPYGQLLTLLGWDAHHLAETLQEDDFLWVKLGRLKPACPPLTYAPPDAQAEKRAAEIKALVEAHFGAALAEPGEPRFAFVEQLSELPAGDATASDAKSADSRDDRQDQPAPIRFLYSYFAVFGDPLLHPELDPYPEGLLARLAEMGVNGVWLHTVLRQLAPGDLFAGSEPHAAARLANLQKLVERAARHGVKVYLYMNEPRAMPEPWFTDHPGWKGAREGDHFAMCTSVPEVRQWVRDGLAHVFRSVHGLGGIFTITASENLTNCFSRGGQAGCPRCVSHTAADVIVEINRTLFDGVRRGDPNATVICWDWGWPDDQAPAIIAGLPDDVYLMSVSEWSLPIERGGVASAVGEYSISAVGPGPRATRHWALARKRGLRTLAKVQANCTWELSAVPFLPVMQLVAEHGHNLADADIDGMMLSWSLGGYPSPNLQAMQMMGRRPVPSVKKVLKEIAEDRYGEPAAADAVRGWELCSAGFREFPYHGSTLYGGPLQMGPANPLFATPSGYGATMVGFPYDDLTTWRAIYPPEVFAEQLEKVARGFSAGMVAFRGALARASEGRERRHVEADLRLTEAAYLHFKSGANQVRFIMARDGGTGGGGDRTETLGKLAREEIDLARRLYELAKADSRIGFEASNHYYYLPLDLVEKVINCDQVIRDVSK